LNCSAVIHEISNYIDGDLDAAMMQEIERHLAGCKECAVILNQTKLTVDLFCDSQLVDLPPEVLSRLHDSLRRKMYKPEG
jgi:predicted anti-sigma-YlaC factor YlaD